MAKRFLSTVNLSPLSSDPASGSEGDAYFNTVTNKIRMYYDGAWNDLSGGGGSSGNSFETINVPNGTDPVADSSTDTLNITESNGIIITGDSSTDTVNISTNATSSNTASTIVSRDSDQAFDITGIDFDTTDTIASAVGRVNWDNGEGTLSLGLKGGEVNLSVGQEVVALCYNGTGSTINKGSVVYISGAQGQRPSITLSDADTEIASSKTFGVVAENIANGSEGFVCTFGIVTGLDTSSFTAGQALWLSSTAGQLTNVIPTQPAHSVFIGYCLHVNESSGRIFVNPQNGYEIQELHNVLISNLLNGQTLVYESSSGLWKNSTLDALPSQTGNSGKYLTTNGTSASWAVLDLSTKANVDSPTFTGTVTLAADPTQALQAATKQYVDAVAQGLHIHASAQVATTSNITSLSSPPASIDGVTLTNNMRVLVKNQSTTSENGVYVFSSSTGALTRASDFDTAVEIHGGDFIFVTGGTQNNDTGWVQTEIVTTVGSDPVIFQQFSGAGTYTAGNGLTLTGSQFSINTGVTADLSTAQTLTNKTIDGANNTLAVRLANDITGFGTGVATALAANVGSTGAFVTFNGALGTPSSATLTNASGLPVSTGLSGLGNGVANFLITPTSANLAAAVTDETGTGALVFGTSPTITSGIDTGSSSFSLINTTATLVDFAGAALTLNMANSTISSGVRSISIGGNGASTSTTTVNIGTNSGGTSNINLYGNVLINATDTATAASHYFIETASDGIIRPKTLANVQTEIVTNSIIQTAVVSPTAAGSTGVRDITISTSAATGGADGDVWLTYV